MDVLDDALRVVASLNGAGVDYIVGGGIALNLHAWADPDIDQITAEDLCGDYPAVRYGPPEGSLFIDMMTRLGEATRFSDLKAEDKDLDGVRVRVATPGTLYRMRKDTVRPIDRADAMALRAAFDVEGNG